MDMILIFQFSGDLREQEWNFDPNEPRYCICNQVSYGDMVACDNEDVSFSFSFLCSKSILDHLEHLKIQIET